MRTRFKNREDAGRKLARDLRNFAGRPDLIVLALPRGGVPVGYEVATTFEVPLDVFVVRKLGVPGREELACGAIATGNIRVINEHIVRACGISLAAIASIDEAERAELTRREETYRLGRPPLDVEGRTVILVDDGLATGATMRAAVEALKTRSPAQILVAVPTAPPETVVAFVQAGIDVIATMTPRPFHAVGNWYDDFTQTTDQEVADLLSRARDHISMLRHSA